MKAVALAAVLLSPIAALAASPEDAYLAARDGYIAALKKIENAKDDTALLAQNDKAEKDLEQKLKAIVGPFAVAGFPGEGELNVGVDPHTEGFGTLDGVAYGLVNGGSDTDKNVVVTTDGLLDKWLIGHRNWWEKGNVPSAAAAAVKTEAFYTQAINTDAAVVFYAELPVAAPPGAKFAHAALSSRTQSYSPDAPDQIFVALEQRGRVFIVNEKLATPIPPIPACDKVWKSYKKKGDVDDSYKMNEVGDAAFRRCFGDKVKGTPGFKAASDQAAAVVAAFAGK